MIERPDRSAIRQHPAVVEAMRAAMRAGHRNEISLITNIEDFAPSEVRAAFEVLIETVVGVASPDLADVLVPRGKIVNLHIEAKVVAAALPIGTQGRAFAASMRDTFSDWLASTPSTTGSDTEDGNYLRSRSAPSTTEEEG